MENDIKTTSKATKNMSPNIGPEKCQAIFVASRDAIMTLEPPSWNFTSANPATIMMFGAKDEKDFLGYAPWKLSPTTQPDGRSSLEKAKAMIEEAVKNGVNLFEWTHRRINGNDFPAEVLLSRVDENGKVYLHALVRDITVRKELEQKIRDSAEEKFRIIFDNTNDGLILADAKTKKIHLANKMVSQMLGYTTEEMQNLRVEDIHPKESLPFVLDQFDKQLRGELKIVKNLPVLRKNSTIFYADIGVSAVSIGGKEYSLGAFHDVTDRRIAELEREQYERFFVLSNEIMVIADPQGAFIKVNPACLRVLGYTEEELLSKPFLAFVHPEDKQLTVDEMTRQMEQGTSLNFENRYVRKDGVVLPFSWRAKYDKEKGITYATARDITEHKNAERVLKMRLEEIEKLNKFMVGRELKMAELKKKIAELKKEHAD